MLAPVLGNVKQKVKGKWRTLRGKQSIAVADLALTVGLRNRQDAASPARRRVSGKTTSWEEHLMPPSPQRGPRNLAEDQRMRYLDNHSAGLHARFDRHCPADSEPHLAS